MYILCCAAHGCCGSLSDIPPGLGGGGGGGGGLQQVSHHTLLQHLLSEAHTYLRASEGALQQPLIPHMTLSQPIFLCTRPSHVHVYCTRVHGWRREEVWSVALQAVQIAMDRKDREREQLSTLLSNLYPHTISQDQMAKGFTRLLHFTEAKHFLNCLLHTVTSSASVEAQRCIAAEKELRQSHGSLCKHIPVSTQNAAAHSV